MKFSVTQAKTQLTELVRLAEAGEEVILTENGREVARIEPIERKRTSEERFAAIEEISKRAAAKATPGPCAARSQDFLYDENGLPA